MAGMSVREALQEIVTSQIELIDHFNSPENEKSRAILGELFQRNWLNLLKNNIKELEKIERLLSEKIDIDAEVPSNV